jgi:hypothetical protein
MKNKVETMKVNKKDWLKKKVERTNIFFEEKGSPWRANIRSTSNNKVVRNISKAINEEV